MNVSPGIFQSARHATSGFLHAWRGERNLRLFLLGYAGVVILGFFLHLSANEWFALLFTGGLFLSIELLNTAIEYMADIVDDHLKAAHCAHNFEDLKATKDVAAAASLMSLCITVVTVLAVFYPYFRELFSL